MKTVTYKFTVNADDHEGIINEIKKRVSDYLVVEPEDCLKYVNYETTVEDNTETTSQSLMYTANVTARIKDDLRK
jgi:hypothetical protein